MSIFEVMDKPGIYTVNGPLTNEDILEKASDILLEQVNNSDIISSPSDAKEFLKYKISNLEYEVFVGLFLDNRNRLIAYKELFRGTIDGAAVYTREVVKEALALNSASMICAHNHPSGSAAQSKSDERITLRLKEALGYMDIRLIDHLVICRDETVSLAEEGIL
jgi:DNA repair protein RadC